MTIAGRSVNILAPDLAQASHGEGGRFVTYVFSTTEPAALEEAVTAWLEG